MCARVSVPFVSIAFFASNGHFYNCYTVAVRVTYNVMEKKQKKKHVKRAYLRDRMDLRNTYDMCRVGRAIIHDLFV